jgi:hypothetical protein
VNAAITGTARQRAVFYCRGTMGRDFVDPDILLKQSGRKLPPSALFSQFKRFRMRHDSIFPGTMPDQPQEPPSDIVPELIASVYETAPPVQKRQLLETLLRPLSLLALAALAGGKFARIRIRNGEVRQQIAVEDAQRVSARDVATLARYVQQANAEVIEMLVKQLRSLPMLPERIASLRMRPAF